jgi:predicted RecB family nuclease
MTHAMNVVITSEILKAYSLCPRKAYLLMYGKEKGTLHEYEQILRRHQLANQFKNLELLKQKNIDVYPYSALNFEKGYQFLIDANLSADKFQANCSILTKINKFSYEPTIFLGTHTINNTDKLSLLFVGYVLMKIQGQLPALGHIVNMKGELRRLKLEESQSHKILTPILESLQEWLDSSSPEEPFVILNKHCPICQFRKQCQEKAIQEDNLSLLDRVTPKAIRQYEKKGIFTIKQLSFLFKPRKRKKRAKNSPPITHNIELQALAIRTGKIYLQELPILSRQETELYLDIEGLPDRNLYYLIGVLICQENRVVYHSFWANEAKSEGEIWQEFLNFVTQYPSEPIYHYGSYEPRAIEILSKRYETESKPLIDRLVNVNKQIYGKVYFPLYSNRLKEIANFVGAEWTALNASGLQSLVWRDYWDETHSEKYKSALLIYNKEDCKALKIVVDELTKIKNFADSLSNVDFANQLKKQNSELGQEAQRQFEEILKFAHMNYENKKISFRDCGKEESNENKKKRGISKKGYQGQRKIKPKISKIVNVSPAEFCPEHHSVKLQVTHKLCKRVIIDLVITTSGVRKITPQYIGAKSYCPECRKHYNPPDLLEYAHSRLYGHGFKAWLVYHRVSIRIPYEGICEMLKEQFKEIIYAGSIVTFIKDFAAYYSETEKQIFQSLLKSSTIHADETRVNINGLNWYGWVFANDNYAIFKLTETREATIAHELLVDYQGVLVSDFYAGYDSVNCKQQKCWVHLIRDLNEDLHDAPFDIEYEKFVLEVRNLIIPIMKDVYKYDLKKRHLGKFKQEVDRFYEKSIININYKSDLVLKYQKRFIRYKNSLFTFLEQDGIPWHNNFAERAIRHLAIQRDNSTPWHEASTRNYFVLLGIQQTCRFQGKSFFKFLFSGETDLDLFETRKRKR